MATTLSADISRRPESPPVFAEKIKRWSDRWWLSWWWWWWWWWWRWWWWWWWWWWCVYAMRAVRTKRSFSFLIRALFFNMLCSGFNLTSMPLYRGLLQHHCPSQKTKGLWQWWLDIWFTVLSDGGKRPQRTFTETARALDGILGTLQGGENTITMIDLKGQ